MDFARLTEALAFKSYEKIADICDDLMLQATEFLTFSFSSPLISSPSPDFSSPVS